MKKPFFVLGILLVLIIGFLIGRKVQWPPETKDSFSVGQSLPALSQPPDTVFVPVETPKESVRPRKIALQLLTPDASKPYVEETLRDMFQSYNTKVLASLATDRIQLVFIPPEATRSQAARIAAEQGCDLAFACYLRWEVKDKWELEIHDLLSSKD